jgi:hypothetical protein
MGLTPPERAGRIEPAPDGVLTRVDVAGRHLGNRLCCHGTREFRRRHAPEGARRLARDRALGA